MGQWSRLAARRRVRALRRDFGSEGARVAAALERALSDPGSRPSSAWFERIEALRNRLETDVSPLSITDYGAGSANDERSETEMKEGVLVEKTVKDMCRASKTPFWAGILHELVLEYRPDTGVELGTCLGLSAAYQGAAMEINGSGRFVTLEGADSLAKVSMQHLDELQLADRVSVVTGRFSDTLSGVIDELKPIGYAFIDGHHDEHATVAYFEQLLPHLDELSVLVFDDTSWTDGMKRAWSTIVDHEAVTLSVDLGAFGVCVLHPTEPKQPKVSISLRGL